jgi:uncharacterized membrane protein YhaH (DUF805 family)
MAENLVELGLEVASNFPDDRKEKRYWVKVLQSIAIVIIFPLLGFLLFEIDFTDLIHDIGSGTFFLIFISFLISFLPKMAK